MKKYLLIVSLLFCTVIMGQNANSLLQIISSNSLLERNPDLRKIQYELSLKKDLQGKGLKADDLKKKNKK